MQSFFSFISYLFAKHQLFEDASFISDAILSWAIAVLVMLNVMHYTRAQHLKRTVAQTLPVLLPRDLASLCLLLTVGLWASHWVQLQAYPSHDPLSLGSAATAYALIPCAMSAYVILQIVKDDVISQAILFIYGLILGSTISLMPYLLLPVLLDAAAGFDMVSALIAWAMNISLAVMVLFLFHKLVHQLRWAYVISVLVLAGFVGSSIFVMQSINMLAIELAHTSLHVLMIEAKQWFVMAIVLVLLASFMYLLALKSQQAQQTRQALQHSLAEQQKLTAIVDSAIDGMLTMDNHGLILNCNATIEQMFGYSAMALRNRHIQTLIPDLYRMNHNQYLLNYLKVRASSGMAAGREIDGERSDGTRFPVRFTVVDAKQPDANLFVGYVTDLSVQLAAEAKLREQDAQIQAMMQNIPGVTFRCHYDANWSMVLISENVLDLTGWSARDFIKGHMHFSQLIVEEDIEATYAVVEQAVKQKQNYVVDYRIRNRAGNERWVSEIARPLFDDRGAVIMIDGILLDITENKRQAAEYEGMMQAINQSSNMAELSIDGFMISANQNFLNLLGYQAWDIIGRHHSVLSPAQSDHQTLEAKHWAQLRQGVFVKAHFHYVHKQGEVRTYHAAYFPVRDLNKKVSKVLMFLIDLNDIKRADMLVNGLSQNA